jgi:hypothetical protein
MRRQKNRERTFQDVANENEERILLALGWRKCDHTIDGESVWERPGDGRFFRRSAAFVAAEQQKG